MVDVLGYEEYVGQGGDWVRRSSLRSHSLFVLLTENPHIDMQGGIVLRYTGQNHSSNAKLILYNMFHCPPPGLASYTASALQHLPISQGLVTKTQNAIEEWGLSEEEVKNLRRHKAFAQNGRGYLALQSTRVCATCRSTIRTV